MLHPDRLFSPEPAVRTIARELYESVAGLPIVSPHGHVDPRLFADPNATFGTPADLLIIPDHYVTRMLYSQGIPLESLGVPRTDGGPVEADHRKIWRLFCAHFHLFRATPSGFWLRYELSEVFGIDEIPSAANADRLYNEISEKLASPEFSPRALFARFRIEVLATTDAATDPLEHHRAIRESGWDGRVVPTFRPDGVVNIDTPGWKENIERLSAVSGIEVVDYASFIRALEDRRAFFRSMGATATDHAVLIPATAELSPREADAIFQRALKGRACANDAARFSAHMLMEMARMSVEDGMVMQLHPGSWRNHNRLIYERFGPDRGADIPVQTEFTRNLLPLLNKYGNDPRLTLIVFTLDESTYSRELAPLAGHYPALKLGPPWWFLDSPNGIARYLDLVIETAGLYNTVGFNDDTRAFCSIPARHDLWRRACANWVAGLVARHLVEMDEAQEMMQELAVGLARRAYKLGDQQRPPSDQKGALC
ncbi:MAG: glucuronate isomerase [Anaerolineae bacterium]|nr:glucuronate isomerase [Anaerolineae bacterium]